MSKTTIPRGGITADAIDGTLIADNAIDSEHYTDGSIDTAHVADSQITAAKTSGVSGLSVARQFRLTSEFTGDGNPIASNWEEVDTRGYGGVGTVNQSSGIFSFGTTGIYLVEFRLLHQFDQSDSFTQVVIQITEDNSSYEDAAETRIGLDNQIHTFATVNHVFDVTNVSTHKARFVIANTNSANSTKGSTNQSLTTATFLRLGDT
jgi:hypothetical protein